MKLSVRLQAILDVVKPTDVVADIGCDHAQLAVALIEQGVCKRVLASDLRLGPITRAKQTVNEYNMNHQIRCIHADGLQGIDERVDAIVIAGMGFDTIQHILSAGSACAHSASQIVLASHTQVRDLREWLYNNGYQIDHERIVYDKFYYEILSIHYEPKMTYEAFDFEFGMYTKDDVLYKEMLEHKLDVLNQVIKQVPNDSDKYIELQSQRVKYLDQLEKVV